MNFFQKVISWIKGGGVHPFDHGQKARSKELADAIINDIKSVDPKRWRHPIVPRGSPRYNQLSLGYGYTKQVDGKTVADLDHPYEDLFIQQHPALSYRIEDLPCTACREGYWDRITEKDCQRIMKVFRKRVYLAQ